MKRSRPSLMWLNVTPMLISYTGRHFQECRHPACHVLPPSRTWPDGDVPDPATPTIIRINQVVHLSLLHPSMHEGNITGTPGAIVDRENRRLNHAPYAQSRDRKNKDKNSKRVKICMMLRLGSEGFPLCAMEFSQCVLQIKTQERT